MIWMWLPWSAVILIVFIGKRSRSCLEVVVQNHAYYAAVLRIQVLAASHFIGDTAKAHNKAIRGFTVSFPAVGTLGPKGQGWVSAQLGEARSIWAQRSWGSPDHAGLWTGHVQGLVFSLRATETIYFKASGWLSGYWKDVSPSCREFNPSCSPSSRAFPYFSCADSFIGYSIPGTIRYWLYIREGSVIQDINQKFSNIHNMCICTLYIQIHICVLEKYYICAMCVYLCICLYIHLGRYVLDASKSKTGKDKQKKTER